MVSKETVEDIIVKCSYRSQLSKYSASEKRELLSSKCNEAELKEYDKFKEWLDDDLEKLSELTGDESQYYVDDLNHRINRFEKRVYDYEKRIVNGYTLSNNPVPNIDKSKFLEDDNGDTMGVSFVKGELEQKQVDSQEEHGYSDFEKVGMMEWFGQGHDDINRSLYEKDFYNKTNKTDFEKRRISRAKQAISSAIHKSKGLTQDTIMFHGGRFDISLNPGDHFNWKGYTSLSYNERSADEFVGFGFMYKCYVPTGTKGVAGNDDQLNNHLQIEHEYLVDKGTGATVLSVDYDNRIVEVLID